MQETQEITLATIHDVLVSKKPEALTELGMGLRALMTERLLATGRTGIEHVIKKLDNSDYWVAPASAKFHGAHKYGLIIHSFVLSELLLTISTTVPKESAYIIGYLHDICKIGNYTISEMWRKNDRNRWESYPGYKYSTNNTLPVGHAEKSLVLLLSAGLKLKAPEIMAISHHMGLGDTYQSKLEFSAAANKTGFVALTHAADLLASYNYELQGVIESLVNV